MFLELKLSQLTKRPGQLRPPVCVVNTDESKVPLVHSTFSRVVLCPHLAHHMGNNHRGTPSQFLSTEQAVGTLLGNSFTCIDVREPQPRTKPTSRQAAPPLPWYAIRLDLSIPNHLQISTDRKSVV